MSAITRDHGDCWGRQLFQSELSQLSNRKPRKENKMGRAFGFITLLAVLCVGAWFYMRQSQTTLFGGGNNANATSTVDLMGIRSDLLAMAQAERARIALRGNYGSLEQMRADGDLTMTHTQRGPYVYSAEVSASTFRIVATYNGPDAPGVVKTISIDQNMQISQQ
jgi:hypothetical protein